MVENKEIKYTETFEVFWKQYAIGNLYVTENQEYIFKYNLENVEKAKEEGFSYIIGFKNVNEEYQSDKLFPFFASRIPSRNRHDIQNILQGLDIEEYSESQLLRRTKGKLFTDRYEVR
mgnify:CR=1 FL=1